MPSVVGTNPEEEAHMFAHPDGPDGPDSPDHAAVDELAENVAQQLHAAHPEFDEVPLLEADETVPPRPEEQIADAARE